MQNPYLSQKRRCVFLPFTKFFKCKISEEQPKKATFLKASTWNISKQKEQKHCYKLVVTHNVIKSIKIF